VRRGVRGVEEGVVALRERRRRGREREVVIKPPALDGARGFPERLGAFAVGADKPRMGDLSALTHGVTAIGEIRAATVGHPRLGSPIAQTGRVQDPPGDPPGFRGCYSAGHHRARGAGQQHQAPPLDAVQGEVPLPTITNPRVVGRRGVVGMGRRVLCGAGFPHVRHLRIELPLEGHEAPHRAHGNLRVAQPTPEATRACVRMARVQGIDGPPKRQPALPGWRLWGPAVVDQPGQGRSLEAGNPQLARGRRDVQDATAAALIPALRRALNDLDPGVVRVGMAVGVPQRSLPLGRWGTLVPQGVDGLVIGESRP
jgi:hypothetical protein